MGKSIGKKNPLKTDMPKWKRKLAPRLAESKDVLPDRRFGRQMTAPNRCESARLVISEGIARLGCQQQPHQAGVIRVIWAITFISVPPSWQGPSM